MKRGRNFCNTLRRRLRLWAVVGGLGCIFAACVPDSNRLYANMRAFFRYTHVITTPPLNRALGNPGQFCKITFSGERYIFTAPSGESYVYTPTALDKYGRPESVSGFVVGTPSIPDLSGNFYNVAFDLVCPNCYRDNELWLATDFEERNHTAVKCRRCSRVYNLDNGGLVISGENGRPLFRYRMSYAPASGTLFIQN